MCERLRSCRVSQLYATYGVLHVQFLIQNVQLPNCNAMFVTAMCLVQLLPADALRIINQSQDGLAQLSQGVATNSQKS
jgi:hypothetical protein